MTTDFGRDQLRDEIDRVLRCLESGDRVGETQQVDFKEDAGRRDRHGGTVQGTGDQEAAATALAPEAACMANSDGGGALIVGVADDESLTGTDLDSQWLRHRIYQLTGNQLTIDARPVLVRGVRLLVLVIPEAIEPIRYKGKIKWRVADNCVEIDPTSWHERRLRRVNYDWSGQASDTLGAKVREAAIDIARDFLRESNDPSAQDLAAAPTPELLRRLNAVTGGGYLTNAAKLLFIGRPSPALDYMRRMSAGGDSTERVRRADRSVIEQLAEVFVVARANNPIRHISKGLATGQVRELPERALREAIVNGLAHRDWNTDDPTVVEHIGRTLRVTSPGGFFAGVNESNIITHPSKSRNTALTELLAALKIAEREGVGVDRMVGDMLRRGQPAPEIRQISGPSVVTSLVGNIIDESWMTWLNEFDNSAVRDDLRLLMMIDHMVRHGWIDDATAGRVIQLSPLETRDALNTLADQRLHGSAVIADVAGTPVGADRAYAPSSRARDLLAECDATYGWSRKWPDRREIALSYASERGRISTTELASMVDAHATNVGSVLKRLEQEGLLRPSRENRRGPGFYYVYAPGDEDA
ncbi:ATP-binding protein [Nocardia xishanensis]|uniref:ATP-binding protein n=1 Tax=Nocardia xishanensis TaxID=238964 RepID=UPI000AED3644|nr:ATP-binding protein [Nocardia xishanensis]